MSINIFFSSAAAPAVQRLLLKPQQKNSKMKKKKTDLSMLCSHHFLHDRYCPLLVTACTNCHFSFASPRNFIAHHRRFGICENDFKLSLRKHGCAYYGAITSHPLAYAEDDGSKFFLQFCNTFLLNGELQHKIIGWAHPELCFYMAAAALHLFIDCTFQCVPLGFAQVMVIMA